MRRPVGVVIAAIVLGLITLLGIFGTLVSLVVAVFIRNPILSDYFRPFIIAGNALALLFFLYCAWTVVDLFRMRNWARISIVVIGSLVFLFSIAAAVGTLAVRPYAAMIPQGPNPTNLGPFFVGLAAFYFLVSLIGVWWIVYFNLAPVRAAFRSDRLMVTFPDTIPPGAAAAYPPAPVPTTSGWRIVLIVWACLLLFAVLWIPVVPLLHFPFFIAGIILTGPAEYIVMLVFLLAALYTGIGLLRKWKVAWFVALLWQILTLVNLVTLFIPGTMARFLAYQQQAMAQMVPAAPASPFPMQALVTGPFLIFCMIPGLIIVVLFTIALFRCKSDYLGG